ncbi:hypothetical protein M595_2629 [Lyngbya aestuarii BL J]|uniref:Uncharacterized protein n=1 Tax=Lyngbya aestuarii BL J TaxID=1348334 RepID=U7QJS4_9CYAN|nr:hypothetical protein M595_2629 [Lyngbya aestuarii BL J]
MPILVGLYPSFDQHANRSSGQGNHPFLGKLTQTIITADVSTGFNGVQFSQCCCQTDGR